MKFLIHLVVFFLLSNGITSNNNVANSLIQDSCKKASKNKESQQGFYNFCVASIKENPDSEKVRNVDDIIAVGVKNAASNMTSVKGIVEKILKERKYKSRLSEKLLRDCLKLYSDGTGSLVKTLEYIKQRDYEKIYGSISSARSVPRACEMEFNDDNQQKSPVRKENDVLFDMIDICQSIYYYAHVHKS